MAPGFASGATKVHFDAVTVSRSPSRRSSSRASINRPIFKARSPVGTTALSCSSLSRQNVTVRPTCRRVWAGVYAALRDSIVSAAHARVPAYRAGMLAPKLAAVTVI
jgi:hypothetical protein